MTEDDKIINLIAYARFFRKWSHVTPVVFWEEIEIALHDGVDAQQISMSYDVPVWLIEIFFEKCILPKST
jgi:hypothetical protein